MAPISRTDILKRMGMRQVYLSMRTEGIIAFSKRIRRCSVDGRKRYENDANLVENGAKQLRPFSFENGLVWTGPQSTILPCTGII